MSFAKVLSELEGSFSLKEDENTVIKAFVDKKDVFAILLVTV